MRPAVHLRLPDGRTAVLGHGDLIGRLESAALPLADPRISEAHAMVSLRGTELKLLALRGRFAINGRPLAEVELVPGMTIELAKDLVLEVEHVVLPEQVPALRLEGMQPRVITGVCSLFGPPRSELRPGFHPTACAYLWPCEGGLELRRAHVADVILKPGDVVEVDGCELEVVAMVLQPQGLYVTTAVGAVAGPLEIVARYESAHIFRKGEPALVLSGISARILSELVAFSGPVTWSTVANEIWPADQQTDASETSQRAKWDVSIGRLRRKLERARIRPDLVRSDGLGNVELSLEAGDVVRDEG